MMIDTYFSKIKEKLDVVISHEKEVLMQAAEKVAETVQKGGIIHMFGCGHSHILTEEMFYRAGGLVPVHPIFHEPLMLHEGAVLSSQLERKNDYAIDFIKNEDFRPEDVMIVLSTSGRNPVPVDVAQFAKEKGCFVIGITSFEYSKSQPSKHKSGKHLFNSVDLVIDNHAPKGDAMLEYPKIDVAFAPSSTAVGAVILNSIFAEANRIMADNGFEPPVFKSGNIEGSDERNLKLIENYRSRIPLLS